MKTKLVGTRHGAAVRSRIGNAALFVRDEAVASGRALYSLRNPAQRVFDGAAGSAAHQFKRAGAYVAGFAQGLLRSPNV